MAEPVSVAFLLLAALLASLVGMVWLALSMPAHAQQVWNGVPSSRAGRQLRWLGSVGVAAALVLCLQADHASMAVLVWIMSLAGAALMVAFTLTWHARWLRVFAPWVRAEH